MNKKIKVLLVVTLLILMVGCSKKLKWSNPEAQLNETTKIKEIKEFGIPIEKYTYILTDDMKLRNKSIAFSCVLFWFYTNLYKEKLNEEELVSHYEKIIT